MSDKEMKKIAIIGPYPPPYGGISVHIQRVLDYLEPSMYDFYNESKTQNSAQDLNYVGKIRFIQALRFLTGKYRVIHHHSPDKYMRLLLCVFGLLNRSIYLHIHGAGLEDSMKQNGVVSSLLIRMLKYVHIIADNKDIVTLVSQTGCRSVREIDAFLPPKYDAEVVKEFNSTLSLPDVENVITTLGWFKYYNNEDLYGFDMMLEALHILRNKLNRNLCIVASVNGIVDDELYKTFLKRRTELNLDEYFILLENKKEIYPLYLTGKLFVRATNTDGSPLSIKEAFWFESDVVASDVVTRPEGCILFKNRDLDQLVDAINRSLDKSHLVKEDRINRLKMKKFSYPLFDEVYNVRT